MRYINFPKTRFKTTSRVRPSLFVVLRVDGDVISGIVADSRAGHVELDVHATSVRVVPVQVPVDLKFVINRRNNKKNARLVDIDPGSLVNNNKLIT